MKHEITRDDVIPMDEYATVRKERRARMTEFKRTRRLMVGPDATFNFECYETMWLQVHEMLFIERGGEEQIPDELSAYNPLIPNGTELVATVMFEIDDPVRRANFLAGLGGVEETITIEFAGESIPGMPEEDVDRTSADGKASAVQFVHFPFTAEQISKFREPGTRVTVGISHPRYGHMAIMQDATREALGADFH